MWCDWLLHSRNYVSDILTDIGKNLVPTTTGLPKKKKKTTDLVNNCEKKKSSNLVNNESINARYKNLDTINPQLVLELVEVAYCD